MKTLVTLLLIATFSSTAQAQNAAGEQPAAPPTAVSANKTPGTADKAAPAKGAAAPNSATQQPAPQANTKKTTAAVEATKPAVKTAAAEPTAQEPAAETPAPISLAQSKANRMASSRMLRHLGGGFGGGRAEGVGAGSSREAAIRNCCYWGQRTPIDIGAAQNGSRWYACVIYR